MRKIMFITIVILMLASCPIIFLFVNWKLEKPRDLEKEAKILKNGIINSYSKKTLDEFCDTKYELTIKDKRDGKEKNKILFLKKENGNWNGNYSEEIENKIKEIPILYKNGKFYNAENDKVINNLKNFNFYFQIQSFKLDKFENIKILKSENTSVLGFKNEFDLVLQAEYSDNKNFYSYFSKNFNYIRNNKEKIIFHGKYIKNADRNIVNIVMETSDLKINEKCGYDILNRELIKKK